MPIRYRQLLNVSKAGRDVYCISFSKNGDYVALGTDRCITVWDIGGGSQFEPDLKTANPLSIAWIDDSSFVVGYHNGSIYTFTIALEEQRLDVSGFIASGQPILHLSSNVLGTELASAGLTQIGIWAKTRSQEGALHWRLENVLPPSPSINHQGLQPISIAWFPPEKRKELLVVYESQVAIWDTDTLSARKRFNIPGSPIMSGALSSTGATFAVATRDGGIQIWDILEGVPIRSTMWSFKSGAFVRFIHGEHGLLVGGHARTDILKTMSLLKTQTLWQIEKRQTLSVQSISQSLSQRIAGGEGKWPLVNILEGYCNDSNDRYFIATASMYSSQVVIWKGDKLSTAGSLREDKQLRYMYFAFLVTIIVGVILGMVVEQKNIMLYITAYN